MKLLFSHATGNANVRAAVTALHQAHILSEFHTSIASFEGSVLHKLGRLKYFSEINRREFDKVLRDVTHTTPFKEVCRLLAAKAKLHSLVKQETGWCSIEAVQHAIDKKVASRLFKHKDETDGVYAYEDSALQSFEIAKGLGFTCFYDLPAAYWKTVRELMQKERERWPDWINTMNNFTDSNSKLAKKDEEIRLADCIFVASSFTANSLSKFGTKTKAVKVIPYGFPIVNSKKENGSSPINRPLKLLYVGKLSQQKGIANLFAAMNAFEGHVELTIVGNKVNHLPCDALDKELCKYKWIPGLPHQEVLQLMRMHDVLLFPSISDGFGLVIGEAMSQGTPVIASRNTGGPDVITHGHNGWLCDAGCTASLQEAIEGVVSRSYNIAGIGNEAMETARLRPWKQYGEDLVRAIQYFIK